jgi:ubiquinone/menaquinone biosynthesis C-methylase UbiE
LKSRRTPAEEARLTRFAREYERSQHPALLEIERAVCGCAYGGTSWTTRKEAEQVAQLLRLGPGVRYLDVGAGSGWPGLFLGRITGCDVTLVDVPLEGLAIAASRAPAEELAGACWVVAADGAALPLSGAAFDAIGHSDVLCCLMDKAAVLRECRRVVRSNGAMVFTVISIAQGLSGTAYQQAAAAGPPFKETEVGYPALLEQTGWQATRCDDLSAEYARAVHRMLREEETHATTLVEALGEGEFAEVLTRRRRTAHALDRGLLRRELIGAIPA